MKQILLISIYISAVACGVLPLEKGQFKVSPDLLPYTYGLKDYPYKTIEVKVMDSAQTEAALKQVDTDVVEIPKQKRLGLKPAGLEDEKKSLLSTHIDHFYPKFQIPVAKQPEVAKEVQLNQEEVHINPAEVEYYTEYNPEEEYVVRGLPSRPSSQVNRPSSPSYYQLFQSKPFTHPSIPQFDPAFYHQQTYPSSYEPPLYTPQHSQQVYRPHTLFSHYPGFAVQEQPEITPFQFGLNGYNQYGQYGVLPNYQYL